MLFREKREEYFWVLFFAMIVKLLSFLALLISLGIRYGPSKNDHGKISLGLFGLSFAIEFFPWLIDCVVRICVSTCPRKNCDNVSIKNFWKLCKYLCKYFWPGKDFVLFLIHCAIGISLIIGFACPGQISLPNQKGLAGWYCICSAYCLFRTIRDFAPPTSFEMFGWFEVVCKDIAWLLFVSN